MLEHKLFNKVKNILKILLFFILLVSYVHANEYKDSFTFKLKKDEQKKFFVKYGNSQKIFQFRWTLYTNGGLVIFRSYDRIVAQNILYLRHKNQSFRVELKTRGANNYVIPYILMKFKEFDFKTQEAVFQLFLSDKESEIILDYKEEY